MNTQAAAPVPACSRRPQVLLVLLILGILGCVQCVAIDGGATELTWSLRTFAGESSNCADAKVEQIRLCWSSAQELDSSCRPGRFRDFQCTEAGGVTLFEIAEGSTKFVVQPLCADGRAAALGSYQSPTEIVREVREGEVVTLGALLIVVTAPSCKGASCTCVRE